MPGEVASAVAFMSALELAVVPTVVSLADMPASAAPVEGAALSAVEPVALPGVVALVPIESCGMVLGIVLSLADGCVLMVEVSPGAGAVWSMVACALNEAGIIRAAAARRSVLRITVAPAFLFMSCRSDA